MHQRDPQRKNSRQQLQTRRIDKQTTRQSDILASMQLSQIYAQIFAGNTIRLQFSTRREMESFRVQLYAMKRKEESHLTNIGFSVDKMALSILWKPIDKEQPEEAGVAIVTLKPPRQPVSYTVLPDSEAAP